jgi:protoporphyrinogen oxidase
MGKEAWQVIWEPLFTSKFGRYKNEINLSWFWARINPRTAALGYFQGGFKRLADLIVEKLKKMGVRFYFEIQVKKIVKTENKFTLSLLNKNGLVKTKEYDLVISTLTAPVFAKIIDLPELKQDNLVGLGAMTMLLRLKNKLLKDGTYWLNVNEKKWPFVAVVEHDNYQSSENYNGESLVYLGRYLEMHDPEYQKSAQDLLNEYHPYLEKLDPSFEQNLIEAMVFKTPFAQPISFVNQSRYLPKFNTSIKNLYWVCMQHVYPFDRGINHAVKSARKLVKHVRMETSAL